MIKKKRERERQMYKDSLRLLNVMKKIKQGAAIKWEPHDARRLETTLGGGEIRNLNNAKGPTMHSSGEEHSRQRKQLVQRREGRNKLGISAGRNLAKSGQCS